MTQGGRRFGKVAARSSEPKSGIRLTFAGNSAHQPTLLNLKEHSWLANAKNSVIMPTVASGNEKSYVFRDLP
jgi:hypothetical protein